MIHYTVAIFDDGWFLTAGIAAILGGFSVAGWCVLFNRTRRGFAYGVAGVLCAFLGLFLIFNH